MNEGEASQCRECSTNWERSISHFDLSSLISMARMQSAQRKKARKKEKGFCPNPGLNRGPSDYMSDALTTELSGPLNFYCFPCNPELTVTESQSSMNEGEASQMPRVLN